MKEVTVAELKAKRDNNEPHQLIDVREEYEVDICNIGGEHLPMAMVLSHLDKIRTDVPVIVHCRSGKRSAAIVNALEGEGYTNCYNLTGGILGWIEEIDQSLERY